MKIAFYAPLKPPHHPTPSGDRRIARLLIQALELAGHNICLASSFRSRDAHGDAIRQQRMIRLGQRLAQRLLAHWKTCDYQPDYWFTYHLYYKAPDLIGPHIAAALKIPYIVAEASWASKRKHGPWHDYHQSVEQVLQQAQHVITINPVDGQALSKVLKKGQQHTLDCPPFIDTQQPPPFHAIQQHQPIQLMETSHLTYITYFNSGK